MDFNDIIRRLKEDSRNKTYTDKGIDPIFQADKDAKILLIGQAPGRVVEETGIPFNDKSGQRLREWMGIDKKVFYSKDIAIVPMDFYFPGKAKQGDKAPRKFIAEDYHKEILGLMDKIELTILIGAHAQKYYLGKDFKKNLTQTVKSYEDFLPKYFPIVHPGPLTMGWVKKNPWFEDQVIPDLQKRIEKILAK